jgi:hypothetical protein
MHHMSHVSETASVDVAEIDDVKAATQRSDDVMRDQIFLKDQEFE